jgi:branched-chain amino acid transport system substrate-binding protein
MLLALIGLLATACSSSGTSTGTGSTGSSGDWVIGSIVSETGAGGQYAVTAKTLNAWVQYVNAQGGIDGHKVKIIVEDDKSSPAGGIQAAENLINDHVIALVQGESYVAPSWAATISKAGIPVVCGEPAAAPPYGQNKDFYPCVPGASSETDLLVKAALAQGKKTIGVVSCVETAACTAAADAMKASGAKYGARVVVQTASFSSPSFAATCLALKNAKADAVFPLGPPQTEFSIIDQCAQQNYKPSYVAASLSNQFLTDKNIGGFIAITEVFPYFTDTPVAQNFRTVMQKYSPSSLTTFPDTNAVIWASGLLFEAAAKAGKLGDNPTPAQVTAGLNSLSNETLGGATAPLTFTSGNRAVSCGFVISIASGKFTTPLGTKPVCAS